MKTYSLGIRIAIKLLVLGFVNVFAQTTCYETAVLPTDSVWGGKDQVGSVLIGNTYNAGQGPGIYIVADGGYRLYLNGELLGYDQAAGRVRFIPMTFLPMKNVISIVGINGQNAPGVLMHLDELEKPYVTGATWKASTTLADNSWKSKTFSDVAWANASVQSSGSLTQTPSGLAISGFPANSTAQWIWSGNAKDNQVMMRYTFNIKAVGFGESTTGGDGGQIVIVKTLAELNKAVSAIAPAIILIPEGTLDIRNFRKEPTRSFCQTPCAKILTGGPSVEIRQGIDSAKCISSGGILVDPDWWNSFIRPKSNKSIIGMGRGASLRGATIYNGMSDLRENILLRNLKIWDVNPHVIEGWGAVILTNATRVWIDHCSFKWISDGNDMGGMKKVTFSWNKWDGYNEFLCSTRDNFSTLVQNTDITYDHIFWNGSCGRVPKTYGPDTVRAHMINNYHYDNNFYASSSNGPKNLVFIENTHFEKVKFPTERVTGGVIYCNGNKYVAIVNHVLDNYVATTEPKDLTAKFYIPYFYTLDPVENVKSIVTTNAGAGGQWGTMPTYSDVSLWSKTSPTVTITSPSEGANFSNPSSISVTANASDLDGSVTKVEFYSGNVLIGISTKSPFTVNLINLATCQYSLVAIAYDNNGLKMMSIPVMIGVNTCTPTINTSGTTTFCSGSSVLLSTNTGASYNWRNGTTLVGTSPTFKASSTGSYTVEVVNGNGSKGTSSPIVVTVNPAPIATITSSNTSFCTGGNVVLNSSFGTGYVWRKGTTTVGTASTYTAKTIGSYTVIVTNSSGCKDTSAVKTITENPLPVLTHNTKTDNTAWTQTQSFTACLGDNVYTGPWPNVVTGWSWTGPNNFASTLKNPVITSINSNQGGIYTATYIDPNGCSASLDLTIIVSVPTATITSPSTSFCTGGSVLLTANAGTGYVWRNGTTSVGTSATYTTKTGGSYTVIVSNANGCKDTSLVKTITVNPAPVISISSPANNATLITDIFPINTSVTGTNISDVSFYNGTSLMGTDPNSPYNFTTPSLVNGTYNLSAIAKNTSNCTDTAKVTVKVNKFIAGIEEISSENDRFLVSPNPFHHYFTIEKAGHFDYSITDSKGVVVESGKAENNKILGENLTSGFYVLTLSDNTRTSKSSLIKQ